MVRALFRGDSDGELQSLGGDGGEDITGNKELTRLGLKLQVMLLPGFQVDR